MRSTSIDVTYVLSPPLFRGPSGCATATQPSLCVKSSSIVCISLLRSATGFGEMNPHEYLSMGITIRNESAAAGHSSRQGPTLTAEDTIADYHLTGESHTQARRSRGRCGRSRSTNGRTTLPTRSAAAASRKIDTTDLHRRSLAAFGPAVSGASDLGGGC